MDLLGAILAINFVFALIFPESLGRWIAKVKIGIGRELSD